MLVSSNCSELIWTKSSYRNKGDEGKMKCVGLSPGSMQPKWRSEYFMRNKTEHEKYDVEKNIAMILKSIRI